VSNFVCLSVCLSVDLLALYKRIELSCTKVDRHLLHGSRSACMNDMRSKGLRPRTQDHQAGLQVDTTAVCLSSGDA